MWYWIPVETYDCVHHVVLRNPLRIYLKHILKVNSLLSFSFHFSFHVSYIGFQLKNHHQFLQVSEIRLYKFILDFSSSALEKQIERMF